MGRPSNDQCTAVAVRSIAPEGCTSAVHPGRTSVVASSWDMIAGPVMRSPAPKDARSNSGTSVVPEAKCTLVMPTGLAPEPGGRTTQRLTDGYFVFKDLGKTQIKGVEDPLNVYEVLGAGPLRTRLQVSARRGLTRFVGRQRELEQMKIALEQAKAGHG